MHTAQYSLKTANITVFENHRKISFNIASEASYIYILSKNAKNSQFDKACNQTVVPDRSVLIDQNFIKNDQYGQFGEMPKTCSQTVLPDMAISIR